MAKRSSPKPDGVDRFYARAQRDLCAQKGLDLAEAGKMRAAKAALREAERWDRVAKGLEPSK